MRILALALSLFAGALIADLDHGPLLDAAEAKSKKVERAETQSPRQPPKRQRQAQKRSPTLPPNIGTGIGTGL